MGKEVGVDVHAFKEPKDNSLLPYSSEYLDHTVDRFTQPSLYLQWYSSLNTSVKDMSFF